MARRMRRSDGDGVRRVRTCGGRSHRDEKQYRSGMLVGTCIACSLMQMEDYERVALTCMEFVVKVTQVLGYRRYRMYHVAGDVRAVRVSVWALGEASSVELAVRRRRSTERESPDIHLVPGQWSRMVPCGHQSDWRVP